MLKSISVCALLLLAQIATSQGNTTTELQSTQLKALFLSPGLSIEQRISDKHSFNLIAGIQPGVSTHIELQEGTQYKFYLAPFVSGEVRNYYARKQVRKELGPNSGNYFALTAGYNMNRIINKSDIEYADGSFENSFFIGPVWGIQRNYLNGFHFNMSTGMGYKDGDYIAGRIGIIINGGFGFYF